MSGRALAVITMEGGGGIDISERGVAEALIPGTGLKQLFAPGDYDVPFDSVDPDVIPRL